MKTLTLFIAWLVGYYYEPCPECGRGIAILNDGRIYSIWCARRCRQMQKSAAQQETP